MQMSNHIVYWKLMSYCMPTIFQLKKKGKVVFCFTVFSLSPINRKTWHVTGSWNSMLYIPKVKCGRRWDQVENSSIQRYDTMVLDHPIFYEKCLETRSKKQWKYFKFDVINNLKVH